MYSRHNMCRCTYTLDAAGALYLPRSLSLFLSFFLSLPFCARDFALSLPFWPHLLTCHHLPLRVLISARFLEGLRVTLSFRYYMLMHLFIGRKCDYACPCAIISIHFKRDIESINQIKCGKRGQRISKSSGWFFREFYISISARENTHAALGYSLLLSYERRVPMLPVALQNSAHLYLMQMSYRVSDCSPINYARTHSHVLTRINKLMELV